MDNNMNYPRRNDIDDAGFLAALTDTLNKKYKTGENKIYVSGISNGGMIAYKFACEYPDKVAGLGIVSANIHKNFISNCDSLFQSTPLITFNGTKDPIMPYEGGAVRITGLKWAEVESVDKSLSFINRKNQCSKVDTTKLPDINKEDDSRVLKIVYKNCKNNDPIHFYKIIDGGHAWPGGWQYLSKWVIGDMNRDIDASDRMVEFFGINH
ncbi:MAG: PHB depolymerase family esterase [Flavobacteriales bacterium]